MNCVTITVQFYINKFCRLYRESVAREELKQFTVQCISNLAPLYLHTCVTLPMSEINSRNAVLPQK